MHFRLEDDGRALRGVTFIRVVGLGLFYDDYDHEDDAAADDDCDEDVGEC